MANVKIVLNKSGVRELLKSSEMQSACQEQANAIMQRAGDGYVAEARNYPERSGYAVRTDSAEAYYDNLNNNTLLKVMQ